MHFGGGINCPPYETADGFLQVTRGCSHNRCLFCPYFKDVPFSKSAIDEIEADIKDIPSYFGVPRRIFLQGADGFAADYDTLMRVAELLREHVPSVQTIGGYARIDDFYDVNKGRRFVHKRKRPEGNSGDLLGMMRGIRCLAVPTSQSRRFRHTPADMR